MKHRLIIKKIIAAFLIGVLALGITPKKTLHNLLAKHTDNITKSVKGDTPQLSKGGFNCQCDNLVAESGFIATTTFVFTYRSAYTTFVACNKASLHSNALFFFHLRGPPVNFQS